MKNRFRSSAKYLLPVFTLLLSVAIAPLANAQDHHERREVKRIAARKGGKTITLTLIDNNDRGPLIMANCQLKPLGAYAATNLDGVAIFENIPKGEWTLEVTYVGYETLTHNIVMAGDDVRLTLGMKPQTLSLHDVEVVAKQSAAGEATASVIGRQAIDHLQAFSLDDIMQLVPGADMKVTNLTSQSNVQIRSLVNDNTNAFGASIVMDGVPMSNNGAMTQGGFSSTAFVGTDTRQISADDIESVEVVRGIPSAEYGDLTSGLVVVHSKVGVTPWQVKAKINPSGQNYSVGKGFHTGRWGTVNFNLDYAQAWGDPRQKTKSFDRYSGSVGWSIDPTRRFNMTTKVRFNLGKDWNGNDPDAIDDGTFSSAKNQTISLTHNGKWSLNKPFSRSLFYTIGLSLNRMKSRQSAIVPNPSGLLPILTARETGYFAIPWMTSSYAASGGTTSTPGNIFLKVGNDFFIKAGPTRQRFKLGIDYHFDWNNGIGYYNDDERQPLRPNSSGRPRSFKEIPGVHQFNAFAEDNFTWQINKVNKLKVQAGLRFTSFQMFKDEATYALSPRFNTSFTVARWLDIRAGFGLNSKTPGMDYLYPDKKYTDRVAANYLPQDNPAGQLLVYHTNVYEVARTEGLKNATNYKTEVGIDIKLPGDRRMSILAYYDKTPTGFSAATEYTTYTANFYDLSAGLTPVSGTATIIDYGNPARIDTVFATTGKVGNFNVSVNKGIELDWDLGKIKPLQTSVYLTGAYMESKRWSKDMNSSNPTSYPASYSQANTVPFKVVYPSEMNTSTYRKFSTMLRLVTHIPALKMVASLSGQAIFYNYSHSEVPAMDPIGWIDTDLSYHEITPAMLADESYTIRGVSLQKQRRNGTENEPTKSPVTWLVSGRLTKELGRIGGFSFYANNLLYHEPWKSTSRSNTLTQQNAGSFSFGVELYFNL